MLVGAGGLIRGGLRTMKVCVLSEGPVLVVLCPHFSQSLPPINNLTQTETGISTACSPNLTSKLLIQMFLLFKYALIVLFYYVQEV